MTNEERQAAWINALQRDVADLKRIAQLPVARVGFDIAKTAQSIPNNTYTAISWDTEFADPQGFIATPGATATVPAGCAGIYAITARVVLTTACAGQFELVLAGTPYDSSYLSGLLSPSMAATIALAVGDTIALFMTQGAGASNSISARLRAYRVST